MSKDAKTTRDSLAAQLAQRGYGPDALKRGSSFSAADVRKAVRKRMQKAAPAGQSEPVSVPAPVLYRRDIPRAGTGRAAGRQTCEGLVALEQAVEGTEVAVPGCGIGYVVSLPVREVEMAETLSETFYELIGSNDSPLCNRLASVCDPAEISHENIVFMDIETTGLVGNSPLFLIGTMLWTPDGFEIRQFFARNYAEERAVLSLFADALTGRKLLVTFNGKSFDMPYIRTRAAATGIPFAGDPYHLDMLHVCRRIWRGRLPNCKLQTLESRICSRERHGDIPGGDIPDAYHEYVRTRNARQMVAVLKHNMLDLVTMADLMTRFPPVG